MCNVSSMTKNQAAIRKLFKVEQDGSSNLPWTGHLSGLYSFGSYATPNGGRETGVVAVGITIDQSPSTCVRS